MMLVVYIVLAIIVYVLIKKDEDLHMNRSKEGCVMCGKEVNNRFLYCPFCQEALKKKCGKCNRLIEVDWRYCPFCGDVDE